MENREDLATEVAENVETTTEEPVVEEPEKVYTEEDLNKRVDEIVGKRIRRKEAKIRKEYDKKYGDLERVLRAGTGKGTVEEMTSSFKDYYQQNGVELPTEPTYSDRDLSILAKAEANDIINSGLDDVIEEVDRLAELGVENMDAREKKVFQQLAAYRQNAERGRELEKLGVAKDVYAGEEFQKFADKFSPSTPITEIYEIFEKTKPKKEIKTMGSMKSGDVADKGVKEFYTRDEALKFTRKDLDNNPELYKAIERSMLKW